MSNHLAIAVVTAALADLVRQAVQQAVFGADVVVGRPQAAETGGARARLYLYSVTQNAGLRNEDLPTRDAAGRHVRRPVAALNLHYLIAFYGDEIALEPQRMMGAVVRELIAVPGASRAALLSAAQSQADLNSADVHRAIEQVKFTQVDLSLDDWTKLWSVFVQTPHAPSLAYQASVVLIESLDPVPAPMPVLRRGEGDEGVQTVLGAQPRLASVHIGDPLDRERWQSMPSYPAARLGDFLVICGERLNGDTVALHFANPLLAQPLAIEIPLADRLPEELRLTLPNDAQAAADWVAGPYVVTAEMTRGDQRVRSGPLPLAIAPRVNDIPPAARDIAGDAVITADVTPEVRPEQRAALLYGDREVNAEPRAAATGALTFNVVGAAPVNGAVARVRVDGVESLPFERKTNPVRLEFADNQKVTIT